MVGGWTEADTAAYRATLAVVVVRAASDTPSAFRAGILGEIFPWGGSSRNVSGHRRDHHLKQIPVSVGSQPVVSH